MSFQQAMRRLARRQGLRLLSVVGQGTRGKWISAPENRAVETAALWKPWKNKLRFPTVPTALGKLGTKRRLFHSYHSPYDWHIWKSKQRKPKTRPIIYTQTGGAKSSHRSGPNQVDKANYVPPYSIALIYTGLGNNDAALEWVQKALVEHSHWRGWLTLTPELDSLRSDPRFTELLQRRFKESPY